MSPETMNMLYYVAVVLAGVGGPFFVLLNLSMIESDRRRAEVLSKTVLGRDGDGPTDLGLRYFTSRMRSMVCCSLSSNFFMALHNIGSRLRLPAPCKRSRPSTFLHFAVMCQLYLLLYINIAQYMPERCTRPYWENWNASV